MPNKCCVPGCKGNYASGPKVQVFSFPKDINIYKQWICAIPRKDFHPSKNSKVCISHFSKADIINTETIHNSRTGETISVNLKFAKLKTTAVPCTFPSCPKYYSKPDLRRESREEKLNKIDENNLRLALEQSKEQFLQDKEKRSYSTFDELINIVKSQDFKIPEGWMKIIQEEQVIIFKLLYRPGPIIKYSIVIDSNLNLELFLFGEKIRIDKKRAPTLTSELEDIEKAIEFFTTIDEEEETNPDNLKLILNTISSVIESLFPIVNEKAQSNLAFIAEQLKLLMLAKERLRYSSSTMVLVSLLYTISPHAYKFLRNSNSLILPHPGTIKSICNSYLTDPSIEEKHAFLNYSETLIKYLTDTEKNVVLLMDEIHIQPYLDYKGGNIVGTSCDSASLAKSAVVFMINSISSKLKEVVHIAPVSKLDHERLFTFLTKIILQLEEIGYHVFCVISDNNAVNSKAMSNFSSTKQLSIVYPHPSDNSRPLFYLFDSVHLLKCIRNNWLNAKDNQTLHFPNFETGELSSGSFHALKELHALENDKLLKYGYTLHLKALFPNSLERQNVKLAINIFSETVKEALLKLGSAIEDSQDTAHFVDIISKWWKIVNVKTPLKGKHLRDVLQEPLVKESFENDEKVVFLSKMLDWLDQWKSDTFKNKLSKPTHTALFHTIHGMLEITKYCFEELKLNYVLLGKFQTDPLEDRFGKYRQLAGGQYHISMRQLYESEKKLRVQSLLSIKSNLFGEIKIDSFTDNLTAMIEEVDNAEFRPSVTISEEDFENIENELPVITYLGGYCCYTALKHLRCEECKSKLVTTKNLEVDDKFNLIKDVSRGGLLYPQETVTYLVMIQYIILNKILKEYEEEFLNVHNKRSFLSKFVLNYVFKEGYLNDLTGCSIHSEKFIGQLIIKSTTNTLLKNYCLRKNDTLRRETKYTERKLKKFKK